MNTQKGIDQIMGCVNVLILLVIALIYVVTGTRIGDDAIAALSSGAVYRGRANGTVAIECVVSWEAASMTQILDTLKENDTRITFYISGKWAKSHARMLARMRDEGHEIGTVGYAPFLDGDAKLIRDDVAAAASVIERITGTQVQSYHSGLRDRAVSEQAARALGMLHVAATADLQTGRGEAEDIVERACEQAFDGSILMIQPTAAAAEALPKLLESIREMGYRPATVGEVLKGTVT